MIDKAILADNQPIGGNGAATLFHESKWLTEWITPENLQIQAEYEKIIRGLISDWDKTLACFSRVLDIPYTPSVKIRVNVNGKSFAQDDAWLDPGQSLMAPKLNCANRAFLLTSLLRQQYGTDRVWVALGNLKLDGLGGHAWVLLRNGQDYIFETTSPAIRTPITNSKIHEGVVYFNDQEVRMVPELQIKEPFSACWCIPFLEDYLDTRQCTGMI